MKWLAARLREPSTWRGLVWLLTACGVSLSPELWEQITAVGMAVAGLIGVLTREEPTTVEIQLPKIDLIGQAGISDADRDAAVRRVADNRMHQQSVQSESDTREIQRADSSNGFGGGWNG